MTVARDYSPELYIADGDTNTFAYNFSLTLINDIRVYTIDERGEKTLVPTDNYKIVPSVDNVGGAIIFNTIPSSGTNVLIERVEVPTQEKDWKNTDGFNLKSMTDEFDKLTRWLQEVDSGLEKAIKVPENAFDKPVDIWNRMILSDVLESVKLIKIENGNLFASKDGESWIMMPKSATIQEFRHRHLLNPEYDILEYRINDTWYEISIDPSKLLPAQAGNAGKFLTTDGTTAKWADIPESVLSVNGQQGEVVLTGDDIESTLNNENGQITATITEHLQTLKNDEGQLGDQVAGIEQKIPDAASSTNQLADKAFVNSTVQTAASNFRGNWETWADVPSDASGYPENYAGSRTPTVNDYLVIGNASDYPNTARESLEGTWRFKYTGTWETNGKNGWKPEYQVNDQPLTQEQMAVLNSGITAEKVSEYDSYPSQFIKNNGDTMTGPLYINIEKTTTPYLYLTNGSTNVLGIRTASNDLYISGPSNGIILQANLYTNVANRSIGIQGRPWQGVYTKNISSGSAESQIVVPDLSGTMARIEDLPDAKEGTVGQVYTKTENGAEWQDAQGGGTSLPDQTGNSGKFLTTDGANASWGEALTNLSKSSGALSILGTPSTSFYSTNIGGASSVGGYGATAIGGQTSAAAYGATAIGLFAKATKQFSIQIGYGTNDVEGSFNVSLGNTPEKNYQLLNADGLIPSDRLASGGGYNKILSSTTSGMEWVYNPTYVSSYVTSLFLQNNQCIAIQGVNLIKTNIPGLNQTNTFPEFVIEFEDGSTNDIYVAKIHNILSEAYVEVLSATGTMENIKIGISERKFFVTGLPMGKNIAAYLNTLGTTSAGPFMSKSSIPDDIEYLPIKTGGDKPAAIIREW